jgi:hypothetical protein
MYWAASSRLRVTCVISITPWQVACLANKVSQRLCRGQASLDRVVATACSSRGDLLRPYCQNLLRRVLTQHSSPISVA